jgi:hypothetical protein
LQNGRGKPGGGFPRRHAYGAEAIDSGAALAKLEALITFSSR